METDLPFRCLRQLCLPGHRILVLCCVSEAVLAVAETEKIRGTYLTDHNAFGMAMGSMQPTELEQPVTLAHQVRLTWGHYLTVEFPLGVMFG